jgi:hypothetical protein
MARSALRLVDRQLAAAPLSSQEGRDYLAAMAAAANYAFANRCGLVWTGRDVGCTPCKTVLICMRIMSICVAPYAWVWLYLAPQNYMEHALSKPWTGISANRLNSKLNNFYVVGCLSCPNHVPVDVPTRQSMPVLLSPRTWLNSQALHLSLCWLHVLPRQCPMQVRSCRDP